MVCRLARFWLISRDLRLDDLDAGLIGAFLEHLRSGRHNGARTRFGKTVVSFLTRGEAEALLAAPDRSRWVGRRDHALLAVAIQTGLRVSELTALTRADARLGTGP